MTPTRLSGGEVAARLRSLRRDAGLTQRELARRAGIPPTVLCAYERGTRMPGTDTFLRIVRCAGGKVGVRTRPTDALSAADLALQDVLALAELLPQRHRGPLTYPVLRPVDDSA